MQNAYPIKCPNGTFNPNPGRKHVSECQKCWEGWYCEPAGRSKPVRNIFRMVLSSTTLSLPIYTSIYPIVELFKSSIIKTPKIKQLNRLFAFTFKTLGPSYSVLKFWIFTANCTQHINHDRCRRHHQHHLSLSIIVHRPSVIIDFSSPIIHYPLFIIIHRELFINIHHSSLSIFNYLPFIIHFFLPSFIMFQSLSMICHHSFIAYLKSERN